MSYAMRGLLLAAFVCSCLAFPSLISLRRKRSNVTDVQDSDTPLSGQNNVFEGSGDDSSKDSISVSDRISAVNNGTILSGKYIIKEMDIAYPIGRSSISSCRSSICLWPKSSDGFVYIPYTMSSNFNFFSTAIITASLDEIEHSTCIRFVNYVSQTDYIDFRPTTGCSGPIGRIGGGQTISLQIPTCIWTTIVVHEVLHSLGLSHEHVRKDRDQYVNVLWDNIQSDAVSNFVIAETLNQYLTAYDYGSIMHYSNTAFSVDGIKRTLVAVPDSKLIIGQGFFLTYLDALKINTLYNCSTKSSTPKTATTTETTTASTTMTTTRTTTTTTTTTPTTTTTKATTTTTTPTTTTTKPTTTTIKPTTTTAKPTTTTRKPTTTTTTPTTTTTTPATTTTKPTTTTTKPTTTTTKPTTTTTTPTTTTTTPTTTRTTTTTIVNPILELNNVLPPWSGILSSSLVAVLGTPVKGCGGNLTSSAGVITSPNFPGTYPNNAYCYWNITTRSEFTVTFTSFDIESGGQDCLFDKLKIYIGRDLRMYYQDYKLCGQALPPPITSNGKSMQIFFTSDSSVGRPGFRLTYQAV